MKKLFLLDAYALIFRSYYAFIKNPRINSKGLNTSAIFGFTNTLLELIRKEQPDYIAVCFDPAGPNFRHDIFPEYKANRQATPEDIKKSVPLIKDIIRALNIPVIEKSGYEADDVVGTVAKKLASDQLNVFMMTPDKDYAQLVEEHIFMYKPRHMGNDVDILGIEEVKTKFKIEEPIQVIDILALWGDSADNIPGAPGIGEKTSQKLIAAYGSVESLFENTADLKGKQKENIENNIEQIKLSKVLATIDIDVPVSFNLEEMLIQTPNIEKVKELFTELEFRTLFQRVAELSGPKVQNPAENKDSQQLDMFADNSTIQKATSIYSDIDEIKHNYILVKSEDQIQGLIDDLKAQKSWSFDILYSSEIAMESEILGISFSWKSKIAHFLPFPKDRTAAQQLADKFKTIFNDDSSEKIAHDIKFSILALKHYKLELAGDLFDTMIAHYLIQPDMGHELNYLSENLLAYKVISTEELIGKKGKNQKTFQDIEEEELKEFSAEKADVIGQLAELLRKNLKKNYLLDLYFEIEMPLISVLAEMEFKGVSVDQKYLQDYSKVLSEKLNRIEQEIYVLADEEFNISSPKQLGIILFDKLKITDKPPLTKTKQYKTGEEIISKFINEHEIVGKILDFRGLKKLISTYVDALPLLVNKETNRIHTSFNQAVAATGRLSSTNPNLQNIPIREAEGREVRKAFIASDQDHVFFSADYSQVELRLMAHLSQDPNMIEAFKSDLDIHTATAAKIFKKPIEEVTKEERSQAKSANFGIIYGISAFGLSQNMNISRKDAKILIDGYFESYPKVKEFMDSSIEEARKWSNVKTLFGRRRNLKDINSQNGIVRGVAERNAINAPIQGTAADVIKLAMIGIHRAFQDNNIKSEMLIQVHDELNFNVLKTELEQVKTIVKQEMEYAVRISVPLTVDMGEGNNWLEAH